jgi:hypothetical protein
MAAPTNIKNMFIIWLNRVDKKNKKCICEGDCAFVWAIGIVKIMLMLSKLVALNFCT